MNLFIAGTNDPIIQSTRVLVEYNIGDVLIANAQVGLIDEIALLIETEEMRRAGLVVETRNSEYIPGVIDDETEGIPSVQVANVAQQTMGELVEYANAVAARPVVSDVNVRLVDEDV